MKKFDFRKKRIAPARVIRALASGQKASAILPHHKLDRFLDALKDHGIRVEPSNARTEEILSNSAMGAVLGGGLGVLALATGTLSGPLGWVTIGGAAAGAGVGYFLTRYRITIIRVSPAGCQEFVRVEFASAN